jgi:ribosomal protein S18 acetylase RimI-like enzyme
LENRAVRETVEHRPIGGGGINRTAFQHSGAGYHEGIQYHFLEARNCAALVDLESALHVSFAGVESRWLYRALCRDALRGGQVVSLVAEDGGQLAGFVTALIDSGAYWKGLAWWRPALALRILIGRMLRRKAAHAGAGGGYADDIRALFEAGRAPGTWAESSARIAKIQFIGVAEAFRGRGVGVELYRRLAEELRGRGLERIDARIGVENVASIKMHHAAGWKLYPDADGVMAVYMLRYS